MRVAISLLVTTVLFGSLAVEFQNTAVADSGSLQMMASIPMLGAKPKQPGQPIPHRGSGRNRTLIEYLYDIQFFV